MTRQVREERPGRPTEGKPICRTGSDPSVGRGGRADFRARPRGTLPDRMTYIFDDLARVVYCRLSCRHWRTWLTPRLSPQEYGRRRV